KLALPALFRRKKGGGAAGTINLIHPRTTSPESTILFGGCYFLTQNCPPARNNVSRQNFLLILFFLKKRMYTVNFSPVFSLSPGPGGWPGRPHGGIRCRYGCRSPWCSGARGPGPPGRP